MGLISKSTLQNLGIKLRVEKGAEASSHETNDEIQTDVNDHEALQDDENIYSPKQEPGDYFFLNIAKSQFRNKLLKMNLMLKFEWTSSNQLARLFHEVL